MNKLRLHKLEKFKTLTFQSEISVRYVKISISDSLCIIEQSYK